MNIITKKKELKALEIISQSCCGQGLIVGITKEKLYSMVKILELDNKRLISEVKRLEKSRFIFVVGFWLILLCFYIWVFL